MERSMSFSFKDVIKIIREWDLDAKQVRDALLLYRKVVLDSEASRQQAASTDLFKHKKIKKLERGTKH
jgi:hypothetical protein